MVIHLFKRLDMFHCFYGIVKFWQTSWFMYEVYLSEEYVRGILVGSPSFICCCNNIILTIWNVKYLWTQRWKCMERVKSIDNLDECTEYDKQILMLQLLQLLIGISLRLYLKLGKMRYIANFHNIITRRSVSKYKLQACV